MKVSAPYTHRFHPSPRLSANQVGDYLSASPIKRRRILSEAKFPSTVMVIRYEDARTAVAAHMASKGAKTILADTLAALQRKLNREGITPYQRQNHKLCTSAIEAFQGGEAKLGVESITFKAPNIHNSKLRIAGVSISVSFDLLAEKVDAGGNRVLGAAVLVFSKTGGTDKNIKSRCQAIALLTYETLKQRLKNGEACDPSMCMAVDVFGGKVYRAKSQQKQLLRTVETSCDEVATVWPTIKPPKDYFGPPIPNI